MRVNKRLLNDFRLSDPLNRKGCNRDEHVFCKKDKEGFFLDQVLVKNEGGGLFLQINVYCLCVS